MLAWKTITGKGATLAASVSVHVALAVVAAHSASPSGASAPPSARSPELTLIEASDTQSAATDRPSGTAQRSAGHTHPYAVAESHDSTPHPAIVPHLVTPDRAEPHAPVVIEAAPTAPLRFTMTAPSSPGAPPTRLEHAGVQGSESTHGVNTAYAESNVDRPATLLRGMPPAYTQQAEEAAIESDVPLEIVVNEQGVVVTARALRRVGYGLDEVALQSVRSYRFRPACRAGQPVAVRMRWLMRFELR